MTFTRDRRGQGSGEPSDFQNSLLAIASDREARIEKAEAEKRAFKKEWEAVRDAVITPVFCEAVDILHSKYLNLTCSNENGCSSVLQNNNSHSLTFRADQDSARVICSGTGVKTEEKFELSALAREDVESLVWAFADHCINNKG